MDSMGLIIILFVVFALVLNSHQKAARKKRIVLGSDFRKPNVFGNARFSNDEDCRKGGLMTGKGIRLAFSRFSKQVLTYAGRSHVVLFAPTGSGKGRDNLTGTVLDIAMKRGRERVSLFCHDVKGQLLAICLRSLLRLGPVYQWNPFNILRDSTRGSIMVSYNPLGRLRADSRMLVIQSTKVAEGLIWTEGDEQNRFFNDGARDLITGLIMAVVCHCLEDEKNLLTVQAILNGDLRGFCREIVAKTDNPIIRKKLGPYAAKKSGDNRSLQDTIATARGNMAFIDDAIIGPSLSGSDFTPKVLREKPCSFFMVMPASAPVEVAQRCSRLLMASFLAETLTEDSLGATRIICLVDEAAMLGRLPALEQAITLARGFGLQFYTVFTDIPTMRRIYGRGYRSFLANSGCRLFMAPNDPDTAQEIADMCGQTEVISQNRSMFIDPQTGEPRVTDGGGQQARALMTSREIYELDGDEILIFAEGVKGVVRAKRRPYYETHRGLYGDDPYEKGKHIA